MSRSKKNGYLSPLKSALGLALIAFLSSCGGGGDGGVAINQGVSGQQGGGNNPPPSPTIKTLTFPSFSVNSKLTFVATSSPSGETSNQLGTFLLSLSDLGTGVNARLGAPLSAESESQEKEQVNHCGYADVCAANKFLGLDFSAQRLQRSAIRARFEELPEGATRDFFLLPAFATVVGEKILAPNETSHCTIFAEQINGVPAISREKAMLIAEAFDSNNPLRPGSGIYDQVRNVFGSEWNQNPPGGNDGDSKIVLFFFSSQTISANLFGYMSDSDSLPSGGAVSNQAEIIYINADKSDYQTLATISHEFQHLVNLNQKIIRQGQFPPGVVDENITLNEGQSELAEEICGFTLETGNELLAFYINDYLRKPEDHEFFDFFETGFAYGQGYLFYKYVYDHFGVETVRAIATDADVGRVNLEAHLPVGFAETFRRWAIANYATNLGGQVLSIYKYPSGFKTLGPTNAGQLNGVRAQATQNNVFERSTVLKPWSVAYVSLEQEPGIGLQATINASAITKFSAILEQFEDQFTSLAE